MALTQAMLDGVAKLGAAAIPGRWQTVMYRHKAGPTATVKEYEVRLGIEQYSKRTADTDIIQKEDRKARGQIPDFPFTPTQLDEFTDKDGDVWKVQDVQGGPGYVWWVLQVRKVG